MLPSKYEINVAEACGVRYDGKPDFRWFCRVDAGDNFNHAKKVAEVVKQAFPAPEYKTTLHQVYECIRPVDEFDWRVGT